MPKFSELVQDARREQIYERLLSALTTDGPAPLRTLAARVEMFPHRIQHYIEALVCRGSVAVVEPDRARRLNKGRAGPTPVFYEAVVFPVDE